MSSKEKRDLALGREKGHLAPGKEKGDQALGKEKGDLAPGKEKGDHAPPLAPHPRHSTNAKAHLILRLFRVILPPSRFEVPYPQT